jgi:hypothetical protein
MTCPFGLGSIFESGGVGKPFVRGRLGAGGSLSRLRFIPPGEDCLALEAAVARADSPGGGGLREGDLVAARPRGWIGAGWGVEEADMVVFALRRLSTLIQHPALIPADFTDSQQRAETHRFG